MIGLFQDDFFAPFDLTMIGPLGMMFYFLWPLFGKSKRKFIMMSFRKSIGLAIVT